MQLRNFLINTGLQAGGSQTKMETSRFNGLASKPMSVERCGSRCEHAKAVETA
jgi:hypothetical protein